MAIGTDNVGNKWINSPADFQFSTLDSLIIAKPKQSMQGDKHEAVTVSMKSRHNINTATDNGAMLS